MMKKRWIFLAVAALSVVTLLAAACGDDDDGDDGDTNASPSAQAQEVTIKMMADLTFEPDEIRVEANRPVRLMVDNTDAATLHDFTVMEMPVTDVHNEGGSDSMEHGDMADAALHMAMEGGMTGGMIEFTPTEPGEYQIECTEANHAEAGMMGTLIVTE